jgi:hypothetical protein
MQKLGIAFIVYSLIAFMNPELSVTQDLGPATIEGKIVSLHTGEPILGAHVFLSGTTIGAVTDASGQFMLQDISPGIHKLVVSIIGFGRVSEELILRPGQDMDQLIKLEPVIYELGTLFVGNLDDKWERHLERFKRLFIGQSVLADSVKILNPEVLRFETRWWGRFTAEALAPLVIENYALGYKITYYLDEFYHSGTITKWDGDPLYTEMEPVDAEQAAFWEENRQKAFFGSLRHFLLTLLKDRSREDGFIIFRQTRSISGYTPRTRQRVRPDRLLRDTDEIQLHNFNFSGRLEIIYTRREEDPRYVQWARDIYRAPVRSQTSYLELNTRPITIDMDGEIQETYGATRYGYFAFRRVADETPREYRPDQW